MNTNTSGELVYSFEGHLSELRPIGRFPEGIRFHNDFDAQIVAGPFEGGRIFGLDEFLLRPDGVGVIDAHEVIESGDRRLAVWVRGYVVPPPSLPPVSLDAVTSPGFAFPDVPFRVTAAGFIQTADDDLADLGRAVAVVEGTVNMSTGRLEVTARLVPEPVVAAA